jgi:asparagine N-glycosylation enzyme membrane subunit Stt3
LTLLESKAKMNRKMWQQIIPSLSPWLERAAVRWQAFVTKLPKLPSKWVVPVSVVAVAGIAFIIRFLHLLDSNYYYIVSPDSNFFHWVANRVMAGQGPPADAVSFTNYYSHSGLAYPLAYISKAVSSVFGLSSADALTLVAKILPPVIGVISVVLIYMFATRISNRRVGLFAALSWAVMLNIVVLGSAGFLDRDGLSMLLFMTGAFLFYISGVWHIRVQGRDVGWLIAGVGVLLAQVLLYVEWGFTGIALLLAVIAGYCVVKFFLGYLDRVESEPNIRRRLVSSALGVNWRGLAFILLVDALAAGLNFHAIPSFYTAVTGVVQARGTLTTQEEYGLSVNDLTAYQLFLIPMVVAIYQTWKRRTESGIFFSSWFIVLVLMALYSKRILLYASPAACLLSGVGLAFLWDWVQQGGFHAVKRIGMAFLLVVALVLSFSLAASFAAVPGMSPNRGWQDALAYMREETPADSVVVSEWGWGYWILDLGQRKPLVDNGYYGYDSERLRDVGLAYSTTDPAEAAQILRKYGASYLVFSQLDLDIPATIMGWANVGQGLSNFPANSLVMRSLDGEFESGGGLEVVYRSPPDPKSTSPNEPEVVILGLTQT